MNPPSRRSTRENAINKETTGTIATKNTSEPKSVVISYDYEAAISQPDIPHSKIDNSTQNPSWSDHSDGLSAPIKKRNLYARGKASVTTKKKATLFKPKIQTKKTTKIRSQTYDVAEIKEEPISFSEITRNSENFKKEKCDAVDTNDETLFNFHQKGLMRSRDIQKQQENDKNDKNFASEVICAHQETRNSCKEDSFDKIDKDAEYSQQNKTSRIPRIKPNFFLSGDSRVCPNTKLLMRNKLEHSTNMKSPTMIGEDGKLLFNELGNSSKKETLNMVDYKKQKTGNILQTVHENSTNLWYPEKSSDMYTDEEFEDLPTPTKESSITGAGDDPRSATLLKSLTLKCDCRSCSNHKYASVHTDRYTETESWSSPEMESARKWKSMKHHKFTDVSSEDFDLLSDYNAVNYNNVKTNRKNNKMSSLADEITKPSSTVNPARMKTYRTSFSFFNVFFDIVFWPFIFLRAKQ